jgi:hypothetical protein
MEAPSILMQTKDKGHFTSHGGYDGVTTSELQTLLELSRVTVRSIEAELENRQFAAQLKPKPAVTERIDKLNKTLTNLNVLGRLDQREARLVTTAVNILNIPQTTRDFKVYQAFLWDIIHHCGRGHALLCAASLGKQRVASLNAQDRIQLVHYFKINKSAFESSVLDSLATEYQVPHDKAPDASASVTTGMLFTFTAKVEVSNWFRRESRSQHRSDMPYTRSIH